MAVALLSLLEIIKKTTDFFASKGVESPRLQAELLIGHALGLKRMQLYLQFERLMQESDLEKIRPLVKRRAAREPLQYILGTVEWGDLQLKVDRRALIPRPETELLLEQVEARYANPPARILDMGTGSGALALALAKRYPAAVVWAVDQSRDALSLARENAAATGLADRVHWVESNWFTAVPPGEVFDLIVSNPPYLTTEEVAEAEPEVRCHEPASALQAEDAGCRDLFVLLEGAGAYLAPGGWLGLETGVAQHARLAQRASALGWEAFASVRDLTDRDRFVWVKRPAAGA